jgi:hypothetical protein
MNMRRTATRFSSGSGPSWRQESASR